MEVRLACHGDGAVYYLEDVLVLRISRYDDYTQ